jgi:ribosomal protein S12 methylthiotransferase accessory factor YcaO
MPPSALRIIFGHGRTVSGAAAHKALAEEIEKWSRAEHLAMMREEETARQTRNEGSKIRPLPFRTRPLQFAGKK